MKRFLKSRIFSILIIVIAVAFILGGIFSEQIATVYQKASAICMECIGIG